MTMFADLAAEFPREAVHWRAQKLTKEGDKALALAYIDARDVQDRLDQVCSPAGWRNTVVETAKGRVICTIEIKIGDEWIGKTDGAGDTDVEGDKGGISDAFKRAAVLWGIGRYLYRLPNVWAPCESYAKGDKKYWKAWKGSPWDAMRSPPANAPDTKKDDRCDLIMTLATAAGVTIQTICESYNVSNLRELTPQKADATIKRLRLTIEDRAKEQKEAA